MSIRDALLKRKPRERLVETPEGPVKVRGMSLACKDRVQGRAALGEPWRAYAVVHCAFDPESGARLFNEEDVTALEALDVSAFEPIVDALLELSVMSDEEREELEGN